jgi:hypothetical protein
MAAGLVRRKNFWSRKELAFCHLAADLSRIPPPPVEFTARGISWA